MSARLAPSARRTPISRRRSVHRDQHDVHHPDAAHHEADAADGPEQQRHHPELRLHLLDELAGALDLEPEPGIALEQPLGDSRTATSSSTPGAERATMTEIFASGNVRSAGDDGDEHRVVGVRVVRKGVVHVPGSKHPCHREEAVPELDLRTQHLQRAGLAHRRGHAGADHAPEGPGIQIGHEPAVRELEPGEVRERGRDPVRRAAADVAPGMGEAPGVLDRGGRRRDRPAAHRPAPARPPARTPARRRRCAR